MLKTAGVVKYAAQREPKETQYGPRVNCVFETSVGEIKIWATPPHGIQQLRKGQEVTLIQPEGKKHWEVENLPPSPTSPTSPTADKPPILDAGANYLDLYAYFRKQAEQRMPGVPPECIQAATACTLIFLDRHYGIDLVNQNLAPAPETGTIVPIIPAEENEPSQFMDPDSPVSRFRAIANWTGHGPHEIRDYCRDNGLPSRSCDLSPEQANQLRDLLFMGWARQEHGHKFNHPNQIYHSYQKVLAANPDSGDGAIWLAWQSKVHSKPNAVSA